MNTEITWSKIVKKLNKKKCRKLGKKFELDNWEHLKVSEKKELVNLLISFLAKNLKMKEVPTIRFEYSDECYGSYDPELNEILIDTETLEDSHQGLTVALTAAHELRHSFQRESVKKLDKLDPESILFIEDPIRRGIAEWLIGKKKEIFKLWKHNMEFENYIFDVEPETPYNPDIPLEEIILGEESEYEKQPIEADARKFEGEFISQFLVD
ncbi:hypothetical protein [Priestia megaterium]|uniref:Uncharacterized protein n=1 Tax=Priestia megaterium TaxID=1404 RepID=A0A6M6E494_PRIMG|nr:hypothetical protein [Priestia megaterium]QJX79989.1 hypothetical protein FDZ14_28205 [Priestia megaterium]